MEMSTDSIIDDQGDSGDDVTEDDANDSLTPA
jgi:hypothetical protein